MLTRQQGVQVNRFVEFLTDPVIGLQLVNQELVGGCYELWICCD